MQENEGVRTSHVKKENFKNKFIECTCSVPHSFVVKAASLFPSTRNKDNRDTYSDESVSCVCVFLSFSCSLRWETPNMVLQLASCSTLVKATLVKPGDAQVIGFMGTVAKLRMLGEML